MKTESERSIEGFRFFPLIAWSVFVLFAGFVYLLASELRGTVTDGSVRLVQQVAMRDGVELATYVYLPIGAGPFPTLILRTPYGLPLTPIGGFQDDDALEETGLPDEAVGWPLVTGAGFALVIQETRGTGASGGVNSGLTTEGPDGYDTIEWVANQYWSNGKIGIMGDSAAGVAAALAAAEQPPALDALYTQNTSFSLVDDLASPGGAVRIESIVAFVGGQMLELGNDHFDALGLKQQDFKRPLKRLGGQLETLVGGVGDPVKAGWSQLDQTALPELVPLIPVFEQYLSADPELREQLDTIGDIKVPVLAVSMWHDVFARSTFNAALEAQERGADFRLLAMPGSHYDIDEPENWPTTPMLDFFRETLMGGERKFVDRFTWQAVGSDELESSPVWPPTATKERVQRLGAGTLSDEGATGTVTLRSDPTNPIVTNAGMSLVAPSGTGNTASLAAPGRQDVVWFDSESLATTLRLRGAIELTIDVTADAPSVDLSARLIAVNPNGSSRLIRSTHVRNNNLIGDTKQLVIDFGDVAFDVPAGSVLRLELTGSDFPAWSLNPHNGNTNPLKALAPVAAKKTIDLGSARLSLTIQ
jgi:putative CocE/NonD family hydrolase